MDIMISFYIMRGSFGERKETKLYEDVREGERGGRRQEEEARFIF